MGKLFGLLLAALVILMPGMAFADAAGNALGVKPQAIANTRTLVVGADIFIGDLVETGARGQVQILFADKTELVVGPSSSLRIADYLIRNDGSAGKLAVDMLSGAFRFATGDSAKNRYIINTPTGTIGVRGTEFDVFVALGLTRILLFNGVVVFCTADGTCQTLSEFCEVGELTSEQASLIGDSRVTTGDLRQNLKSNFIYAENQSPLLRQFWFLRARECLNSPPVLPVYPEFPENKGDRCDGYISDGVCYNNRN